MKAIIKNIAKFLFTIAKFARFIFRLIYHTNRSNPLPLKYNGNVLILANGPSLKNVILELTTEKFQNMDFIVLNFFAFDDIFYHIKPKHYCLADPMYFKENHRLDDVRKLFVILQNNVNWEMTIYIPRNHYHNFITFSNITNKNISITKMNCIEYEGFEKFRYFFYKKGLAMPKVQNITNMAIFIALNLGYDPIYLYGVDHTFFDSLCVNEYNQLCVKDRYFYNHQEILHPKLRADNGEVYKVSDYLEDVSNIFKSHDTLAKYAQYLNVKVFNCTKNSMIDCYNRI